MKINIKRHTKIQKLRKTHNFYLYNQGKKVYYIAKPKKNVVVKRERINFFWPALAVFALVLGILAYNKGHQPVAYAEAPESTGEEIIEVVTSEETTESVREMQGEQPVYTGVCAEYYDIVAKYWSGDEIKVALAVMRAESGCNPNAIGENKNSSGVVWSKDLGLFQINDYYHDTTNWTDPEVNIAKAYEIYKRAGNKWTPWCAYTNGSYKKWL